MSNSDDKPGYGNPPKHSQFKKGKSGNPDGRPQGAPIQSVEDTIARVLGRHVPVRDAGGGREIPVLEVILEQMANAAARGDRWARRDIIRLLRGQLYIGDFRASNSRDADD